MLENRVDELARELVHGDEAGVGGWKGRSTAIAVHRGYRRGIDQSQRAIAALWFDGDGVDGVKRPEAVGVG